MKTTIELPPALLEHAQRLSAERGIPLRAFIEEALSARIRRPRRRRNVQVRELAWGSGGLVEPHRWEEWSTLKGAARERADQ